MKRVAVVVAAIGKDIKAQADQSMGGHRGASLLAATVQAARQREES